jgi:hypothetical protein
MSEEEITASKWMSIKMSENLDEKSIRYFLDLFKIFSKITAEQLYKYIKKSKCNLLLEECEKLETKKEIVIFLFNLIKEDNISVKKIDKKIKKNKELNIIFNAENMKNFKDHLKNKKSGKKLPIEEVEDREIFSPLRGVKY